ncbi:MAG: hypothetical protein WA744_00610, partial [Candidatus Acidiferrales bacterium]
MYALPTWVRTVPVPVVIIPLRQVVKLLAYHLTRYSLSKLSAIHQGMVEMESSVNACPENLIEQVVRVLEYVGVHASG